MKFPPENNGEILHMLEVTDGQTATCAVCIAMYAELKCWDFLGISSLRTSLFS